MAAVLKCYRSDPIQPRRRATVVGRAPRIDPPDPRTSLLLAELLLVRWMSPVRVTVGSPPLDFELEPGGPGTGSAALPSSRIPRGRSEFG